MFCVNCGKQLKEGAPVCDACGARQPSPLGKSANMGNLFFDILLVLIVIGFVFLLMNCIRFPLDGNEAFCRKGFAFPSIASLWELLPHILFYPFLFPLGMFLFGLFF